MQAVKKNVQQKFMPTESERTASAMSVRTGKPWYVCRKDGRHDLIVSEENLKRQMQKGYKVVCVYYAGMKYKNLYTVSGRLQFVM